jgi:hypothetical protein
MINPIPTLVIVFLTAIQPIHSFVPSSRPEFTLISSISALPAIRQKRKTNGVNGNDSGDSNSNANKNPPGYQFFQGDGSYVPNGMSREEYGRIRKDELEREKKMNYGAWGPRFKRTGVPGGDWMIMPNLWTAGQVNRPSSSRNGGGVDGMDGNDSRPLGMIVRAWGKYSAAFILMYLLLDCVQVMLCMWKCMEEHMNPRRALFFIAETLIFKKQLSRLTVMKAETIKLLVSIVTAPLVNEAMERLNRSNLWSKRRMTCMTLASAVGFVVLWRVVLQFVPFA